MVLFKAGDEEYGPIMKNEIHRGCNGDDRFNENRK